MGKHGCNADGENVHCRFCGAGDYHDIHCPGSHVCEFAVIPTVPYYWDPNCTEGMLGCKADGVNPQCRFCAERPFENVTCPVQIPIPEHTCHWPQRGEPNVPHFWDETCEMECWGAGQMAFTQSAASAAKVSSGISPAPTIRIHMRAETVTETVRCCCELCNSASAELASHNLRVICVPIARRVRGCMPFRKLCPQVSASE